MAPHLAALLQLQKVLVQMTDRVGVLEFAAGEQTMAETKRRRLAHQEGESDMEG